MDHSYSVVGIIEDKRFVLKKNVDFQTAIETSIDEEKKFESIEIVQDYELTVLADNILVVSDTNMMYEETLSLLDRPAILNEQFIFLGNFICDNEGFSEYMDYLINLKYKMQEYCVLVRGRNEHNLLEYIEGRESYIGNRDEVQAMIESIEDNLLSPLSQLPVTHPHYYTLLKETVLFYENDKFIFVSSGLDLNTSRWRNTQKKDLFNATEEFYGTKNDIGKTVVFGDKPVTELNNSMAVRPWIDLETKKIGINGDCINGGKLLAFLVHGEDTHFIGVRNRLTRRRSYDFVSAGSQNFNKKPESIKRIYN